MSLVYEALQKAEREKKRKTGTAPAVAPQPLPPARPVAAATPLPPQPPAPAPPHWSALLTLALATLAVGVTVAIVILLRNELRPRIAPQSPTMAEGARADTPTTAPPPARPPESAASPAANSTANDPRFRLTGIMGTPEGGYGAVINGRPVYADQYVDGAIVKKVLRDRVTLDVDGREIVLRLF